MKADIEDPCWTAYALGELSKEEMQEAEVLLSANPELASQVSTLQETLTILQEELAKVPPVQLEPLRREAVLQETSPVKTSTKRFWISTATAALFAIGLGIAHWRSLPRENGAFSVDASSETFLDEDAEGLRMEDVSSAAAEPAEILNLPVSAPAPLKVELELEDTEAPARARVQHKSLSPAPELFRQSSDAFSAVTEAEAVPVPTPTPSPTPVPEELSVPPALQ